MASMANIRCGTGLVVLGSLLLAGCGRDGGEPPVSEPDVPEADDVSAVQTEPTNPTVAEPPFDPEAHQEALQKLGPAHHARMYEAEQARAAVTGYEQELFAQEPYQSLRADIEALRKQAGPEEDEDAAGKPDETLAQKQAELEALLAQDEKWQTLREAVESAQVRRENTRREIAARVRQRMRHEARQREAAASEPSDPDPSIDKTSEESTQLDDNRANGL